MKEKARRGEAIGPNVPELYILGSSGRSEAHHGEAIEPNVLELYRSGRR